MAALESTSTLIYGIHIRESATDGSDFGNAAADYRTLFLGEDGLLHVKDSAGTVTSPSGSAVGGLWKMSLSGSQTLTSNTLTQIAWGRADIGTDGTVIDLANDRFIAPATGLYMAYMTWLWEATAPLTSTYLTVRVGGNDVTALCRVPAMTAATAVYDANSGFNGSFPLSLTSGDFVTGHIFPGGAVTPTARGNAAASLSTSITLQRIT